MSRFPTANTGLKAALVSLALAAGSLSASGAPVRNSFVVDPAGAGRFRSLRQALSAVRAGGADITVRAGTYVGNLVVPARTTIRGEPGARVVIQAPTNRSLRLSALMIRGAGVVLENLEIDGRRDSQPNTISLEGNSGIVVGAPNAIIRNCRVRNTRNMGIFANSRATALLVEGCTLENSAQSAAAGGTPGYHFTAIHCRGVAGSVLRNNLIRGWSQGIGLWYGTRDAVVDQNQLIANYGFQDDAHLIPRSACEDFGAGVAGHGRNRWTRNLIDGSTAYCMEIAQGVQDSLVAENVLRNPGIVSGYGAHFSVTGRAGQETRRIVIENNLLESDGARPETCTIDGHASEVVLRGNRFRGFSRGNGPLLIGGLAGPGPVIVEGNELARCRFGIWNNNAAAPATIRGNRISDSVDAEPVIVTSRQGDLIQDNVIENCGAGILLTGQAHRVEGNRMATRSTCVVSQAPECLITNNTLVQTDPALFQGAIRLQSPRANRNRVERNTLSASAPDHAAVFIDGGASDNVVSDNTVVTGLLALHRDAGPGNSFVRNRLP